MILVDSSIWIDHFRQQNHALRGSLLRNEICIHPMIVGELAMGSLKKREVVLASLAKLPPVVVATDAEVLHFINAKRLYGLGIGYIDAHLLASAALNPGTSLWTKDRRLAQVAASLRLAHIAT